MLILFDQATPFPLRKDFFPATLSKPLTNKGGAPLLTVICCVSAEESDFDLLLTAG